MRTEMKTRHINSDYQLMVRNLKKSPVIIQASLTPYKCDLLHMAIGIILEVNELLRAVELEGNTPAFIAAKNVMEELGDAQFYVEGMCQTLGLINDPDWMEQSIVTEELHSFKGFEAISDQHCIANRLSGHAAGILDYVKRVSIHAKDFNSSVPVYHLAGIIRGLTEITAMYTNDEKDVLDGNEVKLLTGTNARYKEGVYSDKQAHDRRDKEPLEPVMPPPKPIIAWPEEDKKTPEPDTREETGPYEAKPVVYSSTPG